MTLRQKTLIIIGAAISLLTVLLVFAANFMLLGGFTQVEDREMRANVQRAENAILAEMKSLAVFTEDWAPWDDGYRFIFDRNNDFIKKNLNNSTFLSQKLNVLAYADRSGRLVYATGFDLKTKTFRPFPESLRLRLSSPSLLQKLAAPDRSTKGILILPEGPLMVAAHPVVDSEKRLSPNGILLVGRLLTIDTLQEMSDSTRLSLQVAAIDSPALPNEYWAARERLSIDSSIWVTPFDHERMIGFGLFSDIDNKPALILKVEAPRPVYSQGRRTVNYFIGVLILFGLLFGAANLLLLEKTVLSRLLSLSRAVRDVGKDSDPSRRVKIDGKDELSSLADSINNMLLSLQTAQQELRESDAATRALLEGMPDALLRVDTRGTILDYKTAKDRIIAAPPRLFAGSMLSDVYPPAVVEKLAEAVNTALLDEPVNRFELEAVINGKLVNQEFRVSRISGSEAIIIVRDFTERREMEKSLQFFALKDPVTNLFNRAYFDEKMTDLSTIDDSYVGIILCDIDGMRLINESLGHDSGNALLVAAATSVRWTLPPEAIVARIGNDEFGALLLGTDQSQLEEICQRVLMSSEGTNPDDPRLRFSLSVGYASGIPAKDDIFSIFKAAEAKLHRQKLTRSLSSRDMIFQTLQKALEKRDFLTHQHATRIWALALPLAQEAGLSPRRLDNLKLLAQFHDIGKVGIPDSILFKEGPLTDEENEQARLHAEIGYRIALSMPDLFPVADLILKHHEWWNGQGYPLGIKHEEIPLECRIFSIVDAFDSMTNDRPDRKAMSEKQAAAELHSGAGSQFDPYLTERFLAIISL